MKKTALLHSELSALIARLGHGDMLVIADAGLPIPAETARIDLALTRNIPRFGDTLRVVLAEMQVERWIVAAETAATSPAIFAEMQALMGDTQVETVDHATLKALTRQARAVVRTGECTPYANMLLVAGVAF